MANKEVSVEVLTVKMGQTYFRLGEMTCKAVLGLILVCFLGCSDPAVAQADIVTIAQGEIGKGEIGGDNKGSTVTKYTRGKEVAWCAAFVSWVRFQSGARENYFLSARSYWKNYPDRRVVLPRAGDLIVFSRDGGRGHIGIVERVQGDTITSIEGNVGVYPARVKRIAYKLGKIPNLLGFVRL